MLIFAAILALPSAAQFDCLDLNPKPPLEYTYSPTPTGDFAFRDSLPFTDVAPANWQTCCGTYGPCPLTYPKIVFPKNHPTIEWSRQRVIEEAKRLIGTPYAHHHLPEMGGLDCSNFTAFVYNYALGIRFSSRVERQAQEAGRRLSATEPLMIGDLIFLYSRDGHEISHALIYIDETHIIDSTGPGVANRPFEGWYKSRFAWARRVLE